MKYPKILWECFFRWRIPLSSEDELKGADVIIPVAFGIRTNDPGISNQDLGNLANAFARRLSIPVIARWLIAHYVDNTFKIGITGDTEDQKYQWCQLNKEYIDTYQELSQAVEICRQHEKKRPLILAEPDHYWRVIKTTEGFGYFEKIFTADTSSVRKDPLSIQLWTRNKFLFRFYEIFLARPYYLLRGYIKV